MKDLSRPFRVGGDLEGRINVNTASVWGSFTLECEFVYSLTSIVFILLKKAKSFHLANHRVLREDVSQESQFKIKEFIPIKQ